MKKLMILVAAVALLVACGEDDEKIVPKDYGMRKFSADMKYKPGNGGGHDKAGFACKQQTYMKLGQDKAVATAMYGEGDYTIFNILPELPEGKDGKLIPNENYNVTTKVKGWDILFTQYVGNGYKAMGMDGIAPYNLAGILINAETVKVGMKEYTESKDLEVISKAFADLKLSDVEGITYNDEIDAIGTSFRLMQGMPPTYTPAISRFFIIKTTSGEIYKLRFTGFYGKTKQQKVFSCEYALMK